MKANQETASRPYERIARAIHYLAEHQLEQPGLGELGQHVGLSESHLQREFTRWAGVSPKAFLRYLTKESAKSRLREQSVMDAALASGLSGSGRLHDLMISCEGMTPGEYKQYGRDLRISFGIHPSPFGDCLIATTERGICKMAFIDSAHDGGATERDLREEWPAADIGRDDRLTGAVADAVFDRSHGGSLHLLLRGTPFQLRVWEALLSIPEGALASYQQVADMIGKPTAVRSVASAIARNRIGYLIPCHRVIRSNGDFGQYRWGSDRKKAMAGWEASHRAAATA